MNNQQWNYGRQSYGHNNKPQQNQKPPSNRGKPQTNQKTDLEEEEQETTDTNDSDWTPDGPICWRCKQVGHVRSGCRVLLNRSENYNQPTKRGRR